MTESSVLPPDAPEPTPPAGPPPRRRRGRGGKGLHRRHWLAIFSIIFVLAVVAPMMGAAWVIGDAVGFAWLWRTIGVTTHQKLSTERVEGSIWDGFVLHGFAYRTESFDVEMDRLEMKWQPRRLWQEGEFYIDRLKLGHVKLISRPSKTPPPTSGPTPPAQLSLPMPVQIRRLEVASIEGVGGGVVPRNLRGMYRYDGTHHRLIVERAELPWGRAKATLALGSQRPFLLSGQLTGEGEVERIPVRTRLGVEGSLVNLLAHAEMEGQGIVALLDGKFEPFAPSFYQRIRRVDLRLGGVNPHALLPALPGGRLNLALYAEPAGNDRLRGGLTLVNAEAGPVDQGRLPLSFFASSFTTRGDTFDLGLSEARFTEGQLAFFGRLQPRNLNLFGEVGGLRLRALHGAAPDRTVAGKLRLLGSLDAPILQARIDARDLSARARLAYVASGPERVRLDELVLAAGDGRLAAKGELALEGEKPFALTGTLSRFNPSRLNKAWPQGDLNARLRADGQLGSGSQVQDGKHHGVSANLSLAFDPSRLSGEPVSGKASLALVGSRLKNIDADLLLARNSVRAKGAYGQKGDRLQVAVDAPSLALLGPDFAGRVVGNADIVTTDGLPLVRANARADALRLPGDIRARMLTLQAQITGEAGSPFKLQMGAEAVNAGPLAVSNLTLSANGVRAQHQIALDGRLRYRDLGYGVSLRASGGMPANTTAWKGTVSRLSLDGRPGVELLAPVSLDVGDGRIDVGATRLRALSGTIVLDRFLRDPQGNLQTAGRASGLRVADLDPLFKLPVEQTLVLDSTWQLTLRNGQPVGRIAVNRVSGDVMLPINNRRRQPLGLREAQISAEFDGRATQFVARVLSQYGDLSGRGSYAAPNGVPNGDTPIRAELRAELPSLEVFEPFGGPALEIGGRLSAAINFNGTLDAPAGQGRIEGRELLFSDRRTGLTLNHGELAARLDGQRLVVDRLRFPSGQGEAVGSGVLSLNRSQPDARAQVTLTRFQVFDRPDRRLVVSGTSEITLGADRIALTGRLRADRGRVDLPKSGKPELSDDVYVRGREEKQPSALSALPLTVALDLDLGDRFRFVGRGLDVELTGVVRVTSNPGMAPAAVGEVRVVQGRYKAYGQDLDIEQGVVAFAGPLDNPGVNVRARRRMSPVGAGVEVTGPVAAPQVRLIADEPMSDRDKLSWLVLGRASSGTGGDDAAIAASAGAYLLGSVNDDIGLFDDFGLTSRRERTLSNGSVSPAEQVVTVGKQVSRELYLGYEYGITSAEQAVKLAYKLSKSWSVVLRAGTASSVESRYTLRFD